jgi:LemA protein
MGEEKNMKKSLMIGLGVLGGLVLLVLMVIMMVVGGYNKLATMDEGIKNNWAQVENQLKRRSDLIPNLVNTVKGYAAHEKGVFTQIADARSKLAGAATINDKITASNEFSSALSRLLMVVENYPNLKANESFNKLMDELAGTENRLSVERMRYNEAVKAFNTYIKRIPGRIYASIFGFEKAKYFEVAEKDKETPKVEF